MDCDRLTFRPATSADAPALHRLVERAYRGDSARAGWTHEADLVQGPRTSAEALAAIIGDPDQAMLLALDGERMVGCVQVRRAGGGTGYFGMLTVDPTLQAGGLGRRLIGEAEAWAAGRFGAVRMRLTVVSVRAELVAYYERRGYRLTGETQPFPVEVDPPLLLAAMEKPLGA